MYCSPGFYSPGVGEVTKSQTSAASHAEGRDDQKPSAAASSGEGAAATPKTEKGEEMSAASAASHTEGSDDEMPSVAVPSGEGTTTSSQTEEGKGEERLVLASMSSHAEGHDNLWVDQRPRPPEEGQPRAKDMGKEGRRGQNK